MKFTIPIIDQSFYLYIGEDDYYKWLNNAKKMYPNEYTYEENCMGLTGGTVANEFIWIGNSKDKNLIYHEVSHFLFYLYNHLACTEENEFRAYISAWVHCAIFNYIDNVKDLKNNKGKE